MRRLLGITLLVMALAQLGFRGMQRIRSDIPMWDFVSPLASTQAWMNGSNPYDVPSVVTTWRANGIFADRDVSYFATVYPPCSLVMLMPLALMPAAIAMTTWLLVILGLLALQFAALADIAKFRWRDPRLFLLVGASLASGAMQFGILSGQLSLPGISVCIIAFWCVCRQRAHLAGILLGLACALKPQIGAPFFAYFLFTRHWTVCRFAMIVSLAIFDVAIIGMRVANVDWMTGWSNSIAVTGLPGGVNDYGWAGTFRDEMMDLKMLLVSTPFSPSAVRVLIAAITIAMLAVYVRSFPRGSRLTHRDELLALGTLSAISLLPIYHRVYDAVLLTTVLAWILSELDGPRRRYALAMAASMTLFLIPFDLVISVGYRVPAVAAVAQTWWWQSFIAPHYAWALLALTVGSLFAWSRQVASTSAATEALLTSTGLEPETGRRQLADAANAS
ncbi:MAG: DUF2029 domain-containing protein [Anaerolineae bacterium]|nr:DUF2029 domain-containing protein [Phycisphaerae bacterium]